MKLAVTLAPSRHTELVSSVVWNSRNEIFSCSDDKTIRRWNLDGTVGADEPVVTLDSYILCVGWAPSTSGVPSETFAIGCSDGSLRLMDSSGREQKRVADAHHGAVTSLCWNADGSTLVTAGEDGMLKVWSKLGMLRSSLARVGRPIYAAVFSPDGDSVLFTCGQELHIQAIQGREQTKWKAHDGLVQRIDWNKVSSLIASGGEDQKYRIWDSLGRPLFALQKPLEHAITSIAWSGRGEMLAVGSFNTILLCEETGRICDRKRLGPSFGSVMDLAWSSDGAQVVCAGADGSVLFAQLIERRMEWKNIEATIKDSHSIEVRDVYSEMTDTLSFRERIVEASLGHGFLVAATGACVCAAERKKGACFAHSSFLPPSLPPSLSLTASQCFVYDSKNWNTPHIFDVRTVPALVVQSERYFIIVDNVAAVQVYSYDGRLVSTPKFAGLRADLLSRATISFAGDCVAILQRKAVDADEGRGGRGMGASKSSGDGSDVADSVIRLFDVTTGRERGRPVRHSVKIMSLALSQYAGQPLRPVDDTSGSGSSGSGAGVADRLIAFVDRDHDLWIASSSNEAKREKIASMVDSMAWHDASESLLALADGKLVRWVYPHAALCGWDTDTISESTPVPDVGKMPSLMHFFGAKASVRRCVLCLSFSRAHHRPTLRRRSPSSPPAHPPLSLSLSLSLSLFLSSGTTAPSSR